MHQKKNLYDLDDFEIYGVDINLDRVETIKAQYGYDVCTEYVDSDVYIICVYSMDQVLEVLKSLDPHALISIESTVDPRRLGRLTTPTKDLVLEDIVLFPHRYNPKDKDHRVFNLERILGGNSQQAVDRALKFYSNFMDPNLIHIVDFDIAALSKITENAWRFMEIAMAEYLQMKCIETGVSFSKLREAVNTKWNIDIKEARDGIGGACLPKDMNLFRHFFSDYGINVDLFDELYYMDAEYKSRHGTNRDS